MGTIAEEKHAQQIKKVDAAVLSWDYIFFFNQIQSYNLKDLNKKHTLGLGLGTGTVRG